jgi:hypothetical protein
MKHIIIIAMLALTPVAAAAFAASFWMRSPAILLSGNTELFMQNILDLDHSVAVQLAIVHQ